jgi:tripartite-type tricarboxylate transporter receptor subunit TctC
MKRRDLLAASAAGLAAGWPVLASATDAAWPARPLRILAPSTAGSVPDVRARWLAERLTPLLGQPVVVENRPGVGGNLAMEAAARSAPDGYTLVMTHIGLTSLNPFLYERLNYDPKQFALVTRVGVGPLLLLVSPAQPIATVDELLLQYRSGASSYGSQGMGAPPQLVAELFLREARFEATHVPYTNPMQAIADLMAGRVQWLFEGTPVALPLVRAGRLRALAVTAEERLAQLPDVPTMREAGFGRITFDAWTGLAAPPGTPTAMIDRLYRECARALGTAEAAAWFGNVGNAPGGETPEAFSRIVLAEQEKWGAVIKALGIRVQP